MTSTPLYYATVAGSVTGLCFHIGPTCLFAPADTETLHIVREGAGLHITAEVPTLFAAHLQATVIEPRLARLGGGR